MSFDSDELLIVVLLSLIVGILIFAAANSAESEKRWQTFSADHHCKLVSHSDGSSALTTGVSSGGKLVVGSTYINGKDGYLCDNGITYYRDN